MKNIFIQKLSLYYFLERKEKEEKTKFTFKSDHHLSLIHTLVMLLQYKSSNVCATSDLVSFPYIFRASVFIDYERNYFKKKIVTIITDLKSG